MGLKLSKLVDNPAYDPDVDGVVDGLDHTKQCVLKLV